MSHIRYTRGQTLVVAAAAFAIALAAGGCGADEESQPAATPSGEPAASVADEAEGCVARASFETDEPEDGAPSWSPDGRRIAFHSNRDGDFEIWTIDVETCAVKRVTPGDEPDWSPDGKRLVFTRFQPGVGDDGLWSADGGGGDVRRVAPRSADAFPAWSPRGDLIAFDRDALIEEEDRREIHVVRPDGTGLRKLTEGGWHITPAFSPDGAWIAWTRGAAVWRMRVDGTGARQVTTGGGNGDTDPSWSPDGGTIAFTRSSYEIGLQPWVVELESGEQRPLVDVPGSAPDWSPDGRWIVFSRYDDDGSFLSLVRPDGTGLRHLTAAASR